MISRLWAPWRIKYIKGKRNGRCVFCKLDRRYVIERSKHAFSILNIFPYNPGHVMVVPKRHIRQLGQLGADELLDLFQLVERTRMLMERALHPQGFNVGINLGKFAGAGLWRHLHVHIVPRWLGDSNFMPVISGTKIISASLDSVARHLTQTARQHPDLLTSASSSSKPTRRAKNIRGAG